MQSKRLEWFFQLAEPGIICDVYAMFQIVEILLFIILEFMLVIDERHHHSISLRFSTYILGWNQVVMDSS